MILEINSTKEFFEYETIDNDIKDEYRLIGREEISIKGLKENIFPPKANVSIPKNMLSNYDKYENVISIEQRDFEIINIVKKKEIIKIETKKGNIIIKTN